MNIDKKKNCDACMKGKQIKFSFKPNNIVSTTRPLELLHMDLCGPMRTLSRGGKSYIFVIVDDFSRYTWTIFLRNNDDTFNEFIKLCKKIQNEKGLKISNIRSDHGEEFENEHFKQFCEENGVEYNFSNARTLQ